MTAGLVISNTSGALTFGPTTGSFDILNNGFLSGTDIGIVNDNLTALDIINNTGLTFNGTTLSTSSNFSLSANTLATIPTGKNIQIGGTVTVAASSTLTIESDANLYQIGISVNSGNITSKRNTTLKRLDYTYWSSPVVAKNLLSLSPATLPNRFYTYSGTTFVNINPATATMVVAKGYSVRAPNDFTTAPATFTASFTGVPNNGNILLNGLSGTYKLLGNPYPSTISGGAFLTANPGTLYFWTHTNSDSTGAQANNNNASWNSTGAASSTGSEVPNGTIQVGQGFMWSGTGATASFTNAMRIPNASTQFFRTGESANTENGRVWLNLKSNNIKISQTLIGYIPQTTNGFDDSYDGNQIQTDGTVLSSLIGNEAMVIQAKPSFTNTDVVPLGFKTDNAGTYTIALDHVDGFFSNGLEFYIKDNLLGTTTLINTNPYSFVATTGTFNDRFELRYSAALSTTNNVLDANSVVVFNNNNQLNINATVIIKSVKIFDIRGSVVLEKSEINNPTIAMIGFAPQQQVLLVQITDNNNNVVTKKVIF